jgi:hypothetical protein
MGAPSALKLGMAAAVAAPALLLAHANGAPLQERGRFAYEPLRETLVNIGGFRV